MAVSSYESRNTPQEYLLAFYHTFQELKDQNFDGMIITGAPVEHLEFEEVAYWEELKEIMEWSKTHVTSTLHICWGAQAGLYYHYGIPKKPLDHKMFGVFSHERECRRPTISSGDLTTYSWPPIPGTPIRRRKRWLSTRNSRCCAVPGARGSTWSLRRTGSRSLSPDIRNTTTIRLRTSIFGIWRRGCPSICPIIIFPTMTRPISRKRLGAPMPIYYLPIGSIFMCIRRRHTISRRSRKNTLRNSIRELGFCQNPDRRAG